MISFNFYTNLFFVNLKEFKFYKFHYNNNKLKIFGKCIDIEIRVPRFKIKNSNK